MKIVESSGNVFVDLGFSEEEAEALLRRSEEVIAGLITRCRHGSGADSSFCVIHNVLPVRNRSGQWECPVSLEVMETKRERRRGRRHAAKRRRRHG